MTDHSSLADAQAKLLAALVDGAPLPEGFDTDAMKELSGSLSHKRARTAAQVWPRLARCLGPRFATMFQEHVAPQPLLHLHGPLVDGWRLAEVCEQQRELDLPAAEELLEVRLHFTRVPEGVERRSSPLRFESARASSAVTRSVMLFGKRFSRRTQR